MKVCIPTLGDKGLDEQIGQHFGRVPTYTIVDTETNEVKVIPNSSHHMGGSGYPPELMANAGVDVMVCSNLGHRAIGLFEGYGIRVYIGAHGTVRDAVDSWSGGMLQEATNESACREHRFRGEKH